MVDTHFLAACLYSGPVGSTLGLAPSVLSAALACRVVEAVVASERGRRGAKLDLVSHLGDVTGGAEFVFLTLVAVSVDSAAPVVFTGFVAVGTSVLGTALVDGFLGWMVVPLGIVVFPFAGIAALVAFLAAWAFFDGVVDACRML